VWHCYITVLTVGYGDVGLTTDSARLFAALHITLAVSWLSGLLGVVSRLKEERATDLKDLQLTSSMQLSPKLIDFLDPTGDGVSELEFVFGMLGLMGADLRNVPLNFKQHAQPLIHRSQQLDADNSGILNHQDLEFMMDQMQEAVAPDKMKLRKERAEKIRKFLGKRATCRAEKIRKFLIRQRAAPSFPRTSVSSLLSLCAISSCLGPRRGGRR